MAIRLTIYKKSQDIPPLPGSNVFHSTEFFQILEKTPGYTPSLMVAFQGKNPVAKMLFITRRNSRLLYFTSKTYSYGTGEYFDPKTDRELIFNEMLSYFTYLYKEKSFLLEFRNLEEPLFGYRYFRQNQYFPVRWLRVRNSIHHNTLEKWMSPSRKRQIARGLKNGAVMETADTKEAVDGFSQCSRTTIHQRYTGTCPTSASSTHCWKNQAAMKWAKSSTSGLRTRL